MRQYYNGVPISSGGGTDKENITKEEIQTMIDDAVSKALSEVEQVKIYKSGNWTIKEYSGGFTEFLGLLSYSAASTTSFNMLDLPAYYASWTFPYSLKTKTSETVTLQYGSRSRLLGMNHISGDGTKTNTYSILFPAGITSDTGAAYVSIHVTGWR